MRFLIRFISKNAAGGVEQHDKIIDAPAITMGRATDQILHLKDRRARLAHARIEAKNGSVHITTAALAGVTVNGHSERDVELKVGDEIEVGANVIRVIEAPEGADFAISFELSAAASGETMETSWTAPVSGLGGLTKRRLSWVLAIVVVVTTFAVPALTLTNPSLASLMRGSSLLPDDGWWISGPVHSAHSATAAECDSCHSVPFRRVPDSACIECHSVARHAAPKHAVLGVERCASCHLEHGEPPALVWTHQGLCADCHAEPPAELDINPAADFLDAHPGFRVTLVQPVFADGGEMDWQTVRVPLDESATADRSNLKFDHAVHLDPDGILTPDGKRVIDCDACHRPEPGGAYMLPVSMDEHCAGCHALSFDPDEPNRVVPHGDPPGVVRALIEYYSARLLGEDPDAVEQRLRRPGRTLTREDRDRAAAEARAQALAVAEDLFERRVCANCHEVTRQAGDDDVPWYVLPVRLTENFFPHANFSHAAHDTAVAECSSCHAAADSVSSADLLMPDLESCRDCHGSGVAKRNADAQIPSTCILCHGFHAPAKGDYP